MTMCIDLSKKENYYDIWSALSPAYTIYKWLGLAHFKVNGPKGERSISLISYGSFYKIVFYLFISVVICLTFVINDVFTVSRTRSTFQNQLIRYEATAITLSIIVMILSNARVYNNLIKCLKKIIILDENLLEYGIVINNRRSRRIMIFWILFYLLLFVGSYINACVVSWGNMEFIVVDSLYITTGLYRITIDMLYTSWIHSMKERFAALNEKLKLYQNVKRTSRPIKYYVIRNVAIFYSQLSLIIQIVNKCGTVPILVSVAINFLRVIMQAYHLCTII